MSISCFSDRIVLIDDADPDREQVVVGLPADQSTIDAAILDYFGPPPPPLTARERLEAAGFSVDELRELLLGGGSSL